MSSQHKKILLVDDEQLLLSGLRRRLSGEFNVLTATNGAEALELLSIDNEIAVIVADMKMPGMNGIELLKAVQEKAPAVRRLMLTGNADLETAVAAINDGKVMRFLSKPCDGEELKTALSQALAEYEFQTSEMHDPLPAGDAPDQGEQARAAFLSIMNHELRTPLNQILGLASVLEASPPDPDDPASLDYLREIQNSGEHLLSLITRILEFSRLQSTPKKDVGGEITDIVRILNEETVYAREAAAKKNVTISLDTLRRRADVHASEANVRLAVRELLENAIKFNSANGHVSILLKCDEKSAAVKILDTGCGIEPSHLEHILKPFRQTDESHSRPFEGVGLGLALVSAIAELNDVRFSLEPRSSGGAEATLIFTRSNTELGKQSAA